MAYTGQRRTRFGIPPVNPNPRPPNEPKVPFNPWSVPYGGQGGGGGGQGGGGGSGGGGGGNGQGGGGQGGGGSTSTQQSRLAKMLAKFQKNASMPTIPGAAAQTPLTAQQVQASLAGGATSALGLSSFQPTAGQPDPRTPDYWRNVNNLLFNTQSTLRSLNLEGTRSALDRERQISDMTTTRGREQRSLGEDAMRQGLSNSGWLARNEAEQGRDFLRSYEDAQTSYSRGAQDRQTAYSQAIQDYIAGEGEQASTALSDYYATQQDQAQNAAPMLKPKDIRKLAKILKAKKKNRGGGQGGGGGGGGGGHGHGGGGHN